MSEQSNSQPAHVSERSAASSPNTGASPWIVNRQPISAKCAVRSPRVLIAGRCLETVFRQRRVLARALRDAGWDVHLCGDAGDPRYLTDLRNEGFKVHPVVLDQKSKSPLSAIRLILAYRAIVRSVAPDVVHVFNAKPTVMGMVGAVLGGAKGRVATVAGLGHMFMSRSAPVRGFTQTAFRAALALADAVVFYNEDDRHTLVDRGLVSKHKTYLIRGSGVDLTRFAPLPLPAGDTLEVLFVGRLLREKGIDDVLSVSRELQRRGADVRITIVGDLDRHNPSSLSQSEIDEAVSEIGLRWLGPVHDVVPALAASHVVLLPSQREGIPLALVEGGAMGRALVATDVPGCREVVQHETNGLLVPLNDIQALVDALVRLAADRSLVERLGNSAIGSVRAQFAADAISRQVLSVYEDVLAKQGDHVRQQPEQV